MLRHTATIVALGLAFSATAASAASVVFTGNSVNVNAPPSPDAGCAPLLRLSFGPANTAGSSNLGAFTYTQTHCTTGGPGPYSGGVFQYFFAQGDMLSGTYSGAASPSGTAGLLNNSINFVITQGTGRFLGGAGTIAGTGTIDFRNGPPRAELALNGLLDLPAVPEPATWVSMIAGFGAIGGAIRSRRRSRTMVRA